LRVLFLEAGDEALVRRYESSRRPHPLQRDDSLLGAVQRERKLLSDLRADSDIVIDTSNLNVHELRRSIEASFGDDDHVALRATVMSFGFKYGIPVDADLVADLRFLTKPILGSKAKGSNWLRCSCQ
jgi:RNase adapter protein RapZ